MTATRTLTDTAGDWVRIGRRAGGLCAAAFVAGTVLFLIEDANLIADEVVFHRTPAGPEQDLATYYAALLNRGHSVLWDYAVRDSLWPLGFLALMVVFVALNAASRCRSPRMVVSALCVVVGGLLHITNDLMFLGDIEYYRHSGWSGTLVTNMVAIGADTDAISTATTWLEGGSYAVLAIGLVLAAQALPVIAPQRPALRVLLLVEATLLSVLVAAQALDAGTLRQFSALVTGAVVAPLVATLLGRAVGDTSFAATGRTGQLTPATNLEGI